MVLRQFIGLGFQNTYEGPASITDVTGYDIPVTWTSSYRPADKPTKSVWLDKGDTPEEDSDQPTWQSVVNPLGSSGTTSVPYPFPNPFTLPANKRAIWRFTVSTDNWTSDWSKRASTEATVKEKRDLRMSAIVVTITSETMIVNGYED